MTEINITDLIDKMKSGDVLSFEKIISLYEGQIWTHIKGFVNNSDDAEDVFQNVFIKLYNNRKKIDSSKNIKNWLYRVATNTVYDFLRKKQRSKEILLSDDITDSETFNEDSSYFTIEDSFIKTDIDDALSKISPIYKNILIMYYKEGFSYKEISDILDMPIGTVKTNIYRAKMSLSEKLKNYNK